MYVYMYVRMYVYIHTRRPPLRGGFTRLLWPRSNVIACNIANLFSKLCNLSPVLIFTETHHTYMHTHTHTHTHTLRQAHTNSNLNAITYLL